MKARTIRYSVVSITLLALSGLWANTATAQGVIEEGSGDRWRSTLLFYLWATALDGTVAVGGNEVEVDESFSDLVDNLDGAFSARFESHKGKWGYFLDGMYVKLDPSESTPLGTVDVDVKNLILEAGGVYNFNPVVQGLFGARYQDLDLDITLPGGRMAGSTLDWVDGFLGLRIVPVNTEKWRVWLRGDVGVVGDSDTTWNAVIGASYKFNPKWSLVAAYRVLSDDIEQDGVNFDVDYSGIGIAVGYTFQ
jgi:hypothetical protein